MSPAQPLAEFESAVQVAWPPAQWRDVTVLLAVSGGADSVALLRCMQRLWGCQRAAAGRIQVAHFDHRMRAQASAEDQFFVQQLSQQLNLTCHVGEADAVPASEAGARQMRYAFLQSTAERIGARYLATAHTADDQAETVLHRILRGTGLPGLAGIQPRRQLCEPVTLIRPMLKLSRRAVLAYLDALSQAYREDASNTDLRYTRNQLRHEVLPQLAASFNPQLPDALRRLARLASETEAYLDQQTRQAYDECVRDASDVASTAAAAGKPQPPSTVLIRCAEFAACDTLIRRRVLQKVWKVNAWPARAMDCEQWYRLEQALLRRQTTMFPGAVRIAPQQGEMQLQRQS